MPGGQEITGRDRAMSGYPYPEQARRYREAARDQGCTCPDLPPHIHLLDCPLHRNNLKAPAAAAVPSPGDVGRATDPVPSPPRDGPSGAPETTPGEGEPTQLNASPGAGVYRYLADREEEHAADRYWEHRERR